jgi:hypothetical protein
MYNKFRKFSIVIEISQTRREFWYDLVIIKNYIMQMFDMTPKTKNESSALT